MSGATPSRIKFARCWGPSRRFWLNILNLRKATFPVHFNGVGTYSLDIEIFAYVLTKDGDEFMKIQQDLYLRILDAVEAAGTALALPTQATISYAVANRDQPEQEHRRSHGPAAHQT